MTFSSLYAAMTTLSGEALVKAPEVDASATDSRLDLLR